jgi:cobyrinic acid a,c-diamide synthase
MPSYYISAAHKSSGKTTLSIGLCAAFRNKGLSVQAFKKGPDYIDPIWLTQATGTDCYNLDFFTSSHAFIKQQYNQFASGKDVVLVEGNMGLYDGISLDGSDSNAAMAKLLRLPVILVVDCSGTSRGIAPLLNGYQQFDTGVEFAGVILNKLAGKRHETKLREVIEAYTDFNILGAVHRSDDIRLTERHLGLIPGNEIADEAESVIEVLAQHISGSVDIEALLQAPSQLPDGRVAEFNPAKIEATRIEAARIGAEKTLRIGVAMDAAFGFYYPGDLLRFHELGVEIVPFDTLQDSSLPEAIDGLFIGGGFPEVLLGKLSGNVSMRESVKTAVEQGLPTYAECGGLMYLCNGLLQNDVELPLCGIIPATVKMNKRPQGRGYVTLQATTDHPWLEPHENGLRTVNAHEFHYSSLLGLPDNLRYAFSMKRGTGIDGANDGIILHNLLASYTHLRTTDQCSWVDDFVSHVRKIREL